MSLADFDGRFLSLGADEQRIVRWALDQVLAGLERGRAQYGELVLRQDRRDFGREASEELRDGLIYLAAAALRKSSRGKP